MLPIPSPFPIEYAELRTIGQRISTNLQPWRFPTNTVNSHWVGPTYHSRHRITDSHAHPYYEGFVVLDGSVDLITPWETQRLKVGHTMLFSPQVIHQWQTHEASCLYLVFSFDLEFARVTPPRQRWPRCPELLWTIWMLGEAVRAGQPDWAWRAHCYLGVIYSVLLNTINQPLSTLSVTETSSQLVARVEELVCTDLASPPSLEAIAGQLSMSVRHLTRRYRLLTGMTVHERLEAFRLERAANLLQTTNLSIAEVSQSVGLSCSSYFTRRFRQRFNVSPVKYRRNVQSAARTS
jgi:AraC-like DNA-binding protein